MTTAPFNMDEFVMPKQEKIPAATMTALIAELKRYVRHFPTESGCKMGDRLRYTLGATTLRTALVPANFPNDSDVLEVPLDGVYVPETKEVQTIVETIHTLLSSLPGNRLKYMTSYIDDVIWNVCAEIPGAC